MLHLPPRRSLLSIPGLAKYRPSAAWSFSRRIVELYSSDLYTLTSGAISAWHDQSGNARHATDSGAVARRPALATAGPFNVRCADFDGSSDYLSGVAISNHYTNSSAFMIVSGIFDTITLARNASFASVGHCMMGDDGGIMGITASDNAGADSVYAHNYVSGGSDTKTSETVVPGETYVLTLRHEGGNLYLTVNGGAETSVASGNSFQMTNLLRFGNYSGMLDGKLFEAATFNVVPGPAERRIITNYFMRQVGLL